MTIRLATSTDCDELTQLASATMRAAFGPPHNPVELVEEYILSAITPLILGAELADSRSTFFLLVTTNNQLVGYAKMRQGKSPRQLRLRPAIELQRLYLLPTAIGQGWGQQLMQYCLDWAGQSGYRAVWLGVWERNQRALSFYKRMGFMPCGYHFFQFGSERQRDFWLYKQIGNESQ